MAMAFIVLHSCSVIYTFMWTTAIGIGKVRWMWMRDVL